MKNIKNRTIGRCKLLYSEEGLFRLVAHWCTWPVRIIRNIFLMNIGRNSNELNVGLSDIIKNKRVLIIGSGPSAKELSKIPKDCILLSCNTSPKILINKKIKRRLDIYLVHKDVALSTHKNQSYPSFLSITKPRWIITDSPNWIKNQKTWNNCYDKISWDTAMNNFYLLKLISPLKISQIRGSSMNHTSSGIRLLQYALYFGAKEIYLAGIDGGWGGYFWGKETDTAHRDMDNNFIKIVSKKYKNIYSISKDSPIVKLIRYKELK